MLRNGRGLTLVEVLASLAILSFVGLLIWQVFFQGLDYSARAVSKNQMQQEANIFSAKLTRIHQTSTVYEVSASPCKVKVDFTKQGVTGEEEFSHPGMCFEVDFTGDIDPNLEDLPLTLTIYDKNNPENRIVIDTFLYRLKVEGN